MHSEARLLMHKPAGQTDFVIKNIVCDAKVFQQYRSELAFQDDYNSLESKQDIYLSSISVIPQNIDKLFETKPAVRPELPPGVRRLELDDAPDEVKPVPTWTVADYTAYIKQTQIRIDERFQGYTLLNSPLFMFTPNTGPVAMIDSGGSLLQQALLLDLHNGFNLTVPSMKIKRRGQFWVYIINSYLKETEVDLLVILNFEVEPFNQPLSQQIWPSYPSYPGYQPSPGITLRYDNNTGNATAQPVSGTGNWTRQTVVYSAPTGATRMYLDGVEVQPTAPPISGTGGFTRVVVSYSAQTGTTRMAINGVESRAATPTGELLGPAAYAISGLSSDFIRFYIDGVLQEGTVYRVPEGRTLHVTSAGMEADQTMYVVRGNLV